MLGHMHLQVPWVWGSEPSTGRLPTGGWEVGSSLAHSSLPLTQDIAPDMGPLQVLTHGKEDWQLYSLYPYAYHTNPGAGFDLVSPGPLLSRPFSSSPSSDGTRQLRSPAIGLWSPAMFLSLLLAPLDMPHSGYPAQLNCLRQAHRRIVPQLLAGTLLALAGACQEYFLRLPGLARTSSFCWSICQGFVGTWPANRPKSSDTE